MIVVKREVFLGEREEAIQIGPSRDHGSSVIEMYTSGEKQELYWGKFSIIITPNDARELAKALTDAARDTEENKK